MADYGFVRPWEGSQGHSGEMGRVIAMEVWGYMFGRVGDRCITMIPGRDIRLRAEGVRVGLGGWKA